MKWKYLVKTFGWEPQKNIDALQNANAADPCSRITDKEFTALLNFHHDPKQDLYNMFCQVPDHLENMVSVQSIPNQLSFIKWVQGWCQQNLPVWSIIECPLDLHFVKERVDHFIRGLCNPYGKCRKIISASANAVKFTDEIAKRPRPCLCAVGERVKIVHCFGIFPLTAPGCLCKKWAVSKPLTNKESAIPVF